MMKRVGNEWGKERKKAWVEIHRKTQSKTDSLLQSRNAKKMKK
jgi:hypothetical protein